MKTLPTPLKQQPVNTSLSGLASTSKASQHSGLAQFSPASLLSDMPTSWAPMKTSMLSASPTAGQPSLTTLSSPASSFVLLLHWAPVSAVAPTLRQPSLTASPAPPELPSPLSSSSLTLSSHWLAPDRSHSHWPCMPNWMRDQIQPSFTAPSSPSSLRLLSHCVSAGPMAAQPSFRTSPAPATNPSSLSSSSSTAFVHWA